MMKSSIDFNLIERADFFLKNIEKKNSSINAILSLNPLIREEAYKLETKRKSGARLGKLFGKFLGIKSNICVRGLETNCASRTLKGWIAPYDATVIQKIKAEDGLIIGMLNMDEFACGISGETSAFGPCKNPSCLGKIPGGSSSGVAAAISADFCDMALGSDTGGSIRNPASNCEIVGLKPSYGLVSRYGLIDLSMSLDQIGPMAKSVEDCSLLLDVIRGKDEKDTKTFDSSEIKKQNIKKLNIGILRIKGTDKKIQDLVDLRTQEVLSRNGWDFAEVNIKYIDLAVQTYYVLVCSEFYSGTRKFDGRRYGFKIEDSCGEEVLRRIMGGKEITRAEFSGRYYNKSLKVKEIIKKEFEEVFKKFDAVVCPTVPILPWDLGETLKMPPEKVYALDALTIPANLAEICAISIPAGRISNIPIGIQIMCAKGQDSKLINIARYFELEK